MKKILLFVLSVIITTACNFKQKEIDALVAKNDSLQSIANLKDTSIFAYVKAFNDIQTNLDSIKVKENIISQNTSGNVELGQEAKDKINQDILAIYDLIQKSKNKIATLQSRLKKSNAKVAQLELMIQNLNKLIEEKDIEINTLKDELTKLNIKIDELNQNVNNLSQQNEDKENTIKQQDATLNTAYYAVGTKKELAANKVVINKKRLQPNFNKNYFTKIDIRQINSLPIFKKKATLMTSHPTNSYKFVGLKKSIDSLVITNYTDFWSVSKYLVIIVD